MRRVVKQKNLTVWQMVRIYGPLTTSEIYNATGIKRSVITQELYWLKGAGFVQALSHPDTLRGAVLWDVTELGRRMRVDAVDLYVETEDEEDDWRL